MTKLTAVVPAAGLGTRALPNSFANPKELAAVYNKPAMQWVLEEATQAGIEKFVIVVSEEKAAIQRYFAGSEVLERELRQAGKHEAANALAGVRSIGERMVFVKQAEPLGLGHAVLMAEHECDGPFLVVTPDDLWVPRSDVNRRLISRLSHVGDDHALIAARRVPIEQISSYGCPKPVGTLGESDAYFGVESIVEKPAALAAPSNLAVSGRWLLPHVAFEYLHQTAPGTHGEIQLTTVLDRFAAEGKLGCEVFPDGLYFDIGNPLGLTRASMVFAAQDPDCPNNYDVLKAVLEQHGDLGNSRSRSS